MNPSIVPNFQPIAIPSAVARWRKVVSWAVAVILLALIILTEARLSMWEALLIETAGFVLVIFGALGRVWCSVYIAGRKNRVLCQHGPYSLCRNPLYLFSFLGLVGIILVARLIPVALLAGVVFWVYHHFVIKAEEQRLHLLFGEEYVRYCASVPRLWPRWNAYAGGESVTLNPRTIGRGLSEVAWFLMALVLVEYIEHLRDASMLPTLVTWHD